MATGRFPWHGMWVKTARVYAVDIQREMLQKLRERSSKYKLNNIEPVLGKVDDPNLPANKAGSGSDGGRLPRVFPPGIDAVGNPSLPEFERCCGVA